MPCNGGKTVATSFQISAVLADGNLLCCPIRTRNYAPYRTIEFYRVGVFFFEQVIKSESVEITPCDVLGKAALLTYPGRPTRTWIVAIPTNILNEGYIDY